MGVKMMCFKIAENRGECNKMSKYVQDYTLVACSKLSWYEEHIVRVLFFF